MKHYEMPPCVRKTTIGGQAIIEGISMKGPKTTCVAVRKPDGSLEFKERPTPRPKHWFLETAGGPRRLHPIYRPQGRCVRY